jgi:hypothetical protein
VKILLKKKVNYKMIGGKIFLHYVVLLQFFHFSLSRYKILWINIIMNAMNRLNPKEESTHECKILASQNMWESHWVFPNFLNYCNACQLQWCWCPQTFRNRHHIQLIHLSCNRSCQLKERNWQCLVLDTVKLNKMINQTYAVQC